MTIAIAAAGTGGHVFPALAIAAALGERGVPAERILFLGGDRFEGRAVPEAGYRLASFELTYLRRRLAWENLRIPWVVRRSARAMADEMRRSGVTAVLAMGGYVTVPAALAARRARVPLLVHEQNASPTLAARFGSRLARATLLGLPGKSERLPRSRVVGNPLRPGFAGFDRARRRGEARRRYGLPEAGAVLGILGGSQGAAALNRVAATLGASARSAVLHLTGPQAVGVGPPPGGPLPWASVPFESHMEDFYAAVDLVVCRAGAMTVSELAATATPAVLVPLERVGQASNARALAGVGGALVVPQAELRRLPAAVAGLLGDRARLGAMGTAAVRLSRPDAAAVVADLLREVSDG